MTSLREPAQIVVIGPQSLLNRARADAADERRAIGGPREWKMLWPLKPNLMESAALRTTSGSCRFVRHLPGWETDSS
jgi:hypothetical protein